MSDYGMKVSRAGYDVKTCADNEVLFSSSFPLLVEQFSGTYLCTDNNPHTVFSHNLGYVPAFFCVCRSESNERIWFDDVNYVKMGTADLRIIANNNQTNLSYFIFNRNIEEVYNPTDIYTTPTSQGTYSADWGFKVTKDGKDISSTALDDYTSFSGASIAGYPVRHQIIHKSGTSSVNNTSTTAISHGLGYKPMFAVYVKSNNEYYLDQTEYEAYIDGDKVAVKTTWRTYCDANNLYVYNNTGANLNFAFLILKDPLL